MSHKSCASGPYLYRETGLDYNTFRYYDPCGERYMQMDPIGLLGELNTYNYVVDPLVLIDPLGRKCWNSAISDYWKAEAKAKAVPRGIYSPVNILRMCFGHVPRIRIKSF